MAMPDVHSGYGFAIGNVAAFDMADTEAVVSPGGVGFDINCGVRLLRTNLVRSCTLCCPRAFHSQLKKFPCRCRQEVHHMLTPLLMAAPSMLPASQLMSEGLRGKSGSKSL